MFCLSNVQSLLFIMIITQIMLFQLKKLSEIINLTRFLKSFWILYIDQIIVYNAFYSKLTFLILHNKRPLSDARSKCFSFASVATATQLSGSHSGNSFEFSHRLTGFLNYALFCLSFCLRLNLKPVNYLTRRSSMTKRQGSILSFFGNAATQNILLHN
jgi:hypothetical protein